MMRFTTLTATVLALALTLTSCGGGGGTTFGPPSGTAASMFTALNGLRTANGAGALANNAQFAALAQAQANLNAASDNNVAVDATGQSVKQRLAAQGITVNEWAVPLAQGNDTEAIDRWTNTPVERALLYDNSYTDMGVGMTLDGDRQRWVVIMAEVTP
jgi:uncharacterized protein YkwD